MAIKLGIFVLFIFSLTSCQLLYPGEGETVVEQVPVKQVNSLVVDDIFDVYLFPDSVPALYIEAGENQIKTITTQYDSLALQLVIGNSASMRVTQGYKRIKVYLHSNTLTSVEITVAGSLYFIDTLTVPQFRFASVGDMGNADIILNTNYIEIDNVDTNGRFKIRGHANRLKINNKGLSIVDARDLDANEIECNQYSLGDCFVKASEKLKWAIYRAGNIYQSGVIEDIEGTRFGSGNLFVLE